MICPHCNQFIHLQANLFNQAFPIYHHSPYAMFKKNPSWIKAGVCPNPECHKVIIGLEFSKDNNGAEDKQIFKIIFPQSSTAPMPIPEMPEEIKQDYMEARDVVDASPRAAAALLRLCVQKLMPLLGEKGKNVNDDISSLVKKGLPVEIQQSLDILRVIGNESVHPGEINLNDDRETANSLFGILNFIVDNMIVQPQKRKAFYEKLPDSKKRKN